MSEFNAPTINLLKTDPDLTYLLQEFKRDILLSFNCHAIATVSSFDSSNLTVNATVNYKRIYMQQTNNVYTPVLQNYAPLLSCPIYLPQGGDAALTMPIAVGDECIILFNDRDIDNWFKSGQVVAPNTTRLHSFSDSLALVGVRNSNRLLANYDLVRAVLRNGNAMVGVGPQLIKIANNSTSLLTLINGLIDVIKGLTTLNSDSTTGAVSAASQVLLELYKTNLAGLLE